MRRQARPQRNKALPLHFLALALLAHVPLLLLTVERGSDPPGARSLEVELRRAAAAPEPPTPQPSEPPETEAAPLPVAAVKPPEPTPRLPEAAAEPAPPAASLPSVRRIIESIEQLGPEPGPAPQALPGRATHSAAYAAMSRPLLTLPANVLDGAVAPARAEIVDRWLSPGGVHQVVVRSPDGNTYCGRQEAADPFRPWTQMPMLFHACPGGGKR